MKKILILIVLLSTIFFIGCNKESLDQNSNVDFEKLNSSKSNQNSDINLNISSEKEKKFITVDDSKINKFVLNNNEYSLEISSINKDGLYKVKLNNVEKNVVEPFKKIEFDGIFLFVLDIVHSTRNSVKPYSEIIIGNYDFDIKPEDVKDCVEIKTSNLNENKKKLDITFGLNKEQNKVLIKEDFCQDSNTLIEFYCEQENNLNFVKSQNVNCEFGCENGYCLLDDVSLDNLDDYPKIKVNNIKITFGDFDQKTISLYDVDYDIKIIKIEEKFVTLSVNQKVEKVEINNKKLINGIYIYFDEVMYSARENVKSYVELTFNKK